MKFRETNFGLFETRAKSGLMGLASGPYSLAASVQTVIKLQFEKRTSYHHRVDILSE
jgi:hypothetical protein